MPKRKKETDAEISVKVERLMASWPKKIQREISKFLGNAVAGHGTQLSKKAMEKWRYLRVRYMSAMLPFLLLLSGCMAHFDRHVEHAHQDYLTFQSNHQSEFGQQTKRHDWEVGFWWDHYLVDRANRGKNLYPSITDGSCIEPTHGIWATFSGRCMLQEIEAAKHSWRLSQ